MKAIATFLQPTSAVVSLKTTLTEDKDTEFLVVAKSCSIEVFAILPDGIRLRCSESIWGRITSMHDIPTDDSSKCNLLVTTDHPDPKAFLLEYTQLDPSKPRLKLLRSLSLHEKFSRPAEFWVGCLVQQRGRVAVINSYVGKLKVLELEKGKIINDFDVSIRELNLLSACFLRMTSTRSLVLAMLHINHLQQLVLTSHEVSVSDREISSKPSPLFSNIIIEDSGANILVPVPPHSDSNWNTSGGILVLGGKTIYFYSIDRKQKKKGNTIRMTSDAKLSSATVVWPYSEITAWSEVDVDCTRILLGDSFGRLVILSFNKKSPGLDLLFLGEVSSPTSLTILPSQYIYVTSHFGDSQIVQIVPDKPNGSYIDVVDSYKNIAPIMDAIVEDIDDSGQPTIITCSGGANSGSLRVIRNGANFHEDARIAGVHNIINLWPSRLRTSDKQDTYIVSSTWNSTYTFELPSNNYENRVVHTSDFLTDLDRNSTTLVAGNFFNRVTSQSGKATYEDSHFYVQVTPKAITLLNTVMGLKDDRWQPQGHEITLADCSPTQILVAMPGGLIRLFSIEDGKLKTNDHCEKVFAGEISAISISPQSRTSKFSKYIVLGFWRTNTVKVFSLPNFNLVHTQTMSHTPRSVLLYNFEDGNSSHQYLVVSMANGKITLFPFSKDALGERKDVQLGDSPLMLSRCEVNGQSALLASGARSALFYWEKGTLNQSAVLIKDVLASQTFTLHQPGSSLVLSTSEGLVLGRILELDKLHIRTIHMGLENPIKIAYHHPTKSFGVGCVKHIVDELTGPSGSRPATGSCSCFKILSAADYSTTHEFPLESNEEVTCVATVDLTEQGNIFAVSTMYYAEDESEPSRGRIMLFSPGSLSGGHPYLLASTHAEGAVHSLASANGDLVSAINNGVYVFRLVSSDINGDNIRTAALEIAGSWVHNYMITNLLSNKDHIIVGDAISSITVLSFKEYGFKMVVKDYSPLWPISLGLMDDKTILGANADCNLFSFRLQNQDNNNCVLENDGLFYMDEVVNKVVTGGLGATENNYNLETKSLIFTSTGRISAVVDVGDTLSRLLSSLERNLSGLKKGLGDIDHTLWRAPANYRGRSEAQMAPVGFLDGDFLESFLDYPAGSQEVERVMKGRNEAEKLNTTYGELRSILESLRSTHE